MSSSRVQRGEIVLVDVPYLDASAAVRRPALIVSDPSAMLDLIIAAISSRIRSPLPQTHYVVDQQHSDWPASGLRLPSVIRCDRLFTIAHNDIRRTLGSLSNATMQQLSDIMKTALGIS